MSQNQLKDLLKPELINSVAGLSLIARVMVDSGQAGLHKSRSVGQGMEFSQYRAYEPGDDLRLLDWKMLARSGRYYMKQADVDTHITIKFILDCSKSMQHREDALSKLEYARVLIAALAYLAKNQGDALGLYAISDKQLFQLPTRAHKEQYNRLLLELLKIKPEGRWPEAARVPQQIQQSGRKEMLFFITDFYEDQNELTDSIKALKTSRNEVIVLHLMGNQELTFNYKGMYTFEDLETGKRVKVEARQTKKDYLDALNKRLEHIKTSLLQHGIDYELLDYGELPGVLIESYLKKRSRLQ